MNRLIFSFAAITLVASCNGIREGKEFRISGNLTGVEESTMIYYRQSDGSDLTTVDSAVLTDGRFVFKGSLDYPQMIYLQIGDSRQMINIFAENTDMEVSSSVDSLDKTIVRGSVSHDELIAFNAHMKPLDAEYASLISRYREAAANNDSELLQKIDEEYDDLSNRQKKGILEFLDDKNASFLKPYLIRRQLSYQIDGPELETLITPIEPEVRISKDYVFLAERVETLKRVAIGQQAPDFTLSDPEGNPVSLSSLNGNYVLIDFWASWCGPCRRENPNVVQLYNEYSSKGFEILGVSLDEDREKWVQAINDDQLTWRHVSDLRRWGSEAGKLYGVNSIPHTVLIDPDGIIIAKNLRGAELVAKLQELLGAKENT